MSDVEKAKVAVVGASGYSGIELLRILLKHPGVDLTTVTSRQNAGKSLVEVLPQFKAYPGADGLKFTSPSVHELAKSGIEFAFLALPHGVAAEYAVPLFEAGVKVIDLSADFRLNEASVYREFYDKVHPAPALLKEAVYGLPEIRAKEIANARIVASPGCYPTSMLLPLIPLVRSGLIESNTIVVNSMSGVSGAGRSAAIPLLFAECNESVRPYGLPRHRHLSEVEQELTIAARKPVKITFIPHLVPITQGICTTIVAELAPRCTSMSQVEAVLEAVYRNAPFVRLLGNGGFPDTRHVRQTNFVDIGWHHDPRTKRLVLTSAEDNLWKGAAAQSVQSFNLMRRIDETTGLL
ncbi:N-acetyl-gamma-glutamyl-phosphate reductase [Sulfuriroseicoccus oceanibius]|uniref:N-acetyl-gamma-glutamyl-phosphate reductase n=1 Tax=Sulfuriroseicoccus oceanibius TaxID=2707525 RepID=A0A6B3L7B5_9BACT|nr:N-acetyl-gamma-glutamyl-phosphate reductase [Sulfuriroseicoccus oceanibius]QQL44358.1 N-acetyl-gamma-glutamyl-phosphate reductase [Sulfuriroseicoccus oceanibius]